jgi:cytochrome c biogenesis protein CcmG/thiol:disulfide interchange protein DsbE
MANRQRAEARRKAQAKAARSGEGGNKMMLWIALGVVVLLGGGIAFFATRGDDATASDNSSASTPSNNFPDSQPVTIIGEPLVAYAAGGTDLAVGMPAPKLEGLDFRGQDITVSSEDGPYMVIFLAHWCPHCNAEVPRLIDWRNSGAVPADLNVIGVATAVAKTGANYPPSTWFSNKGWPWPVLVDEADGDGLAGLAAQAYGASGWPYFVIVGEDGLVKVRVSGEVESAELQEIVAAALAS